jgi:hypothetical protein
MTLLADPETIPTDRPLNDYQRMQLAAAGAAPWLKRKRSKCRRPTRQHEPRVRIGASRERLYDLVSRHCQRFPTEERLILAACGSAMPASPCACGRCRGERFQGWPVGYKWMGTDESYECGLFRQSEFFLTHLPHSSSIVKFA